MAQPQRRPSLDSDVEEDPERGKKVRNIFLVNTGSLIYANFINCGKVILPQSISQGIKVHTF